MSAPGKLETWQQQRARINAEKEASKIVSKPTKIERVQIPVELVEVPVEVKVDVPVEVLVEAVEPEVEVSVEEIKSPEPIQEEVKVELKPISKKNKIKE